ncbi:hypothetical protein EMVG_00305 [Emiliania huxleyi virus PS401]|nr:hypothetical protein EMVG_00305 [Emiliania huxleyi virus PS401]
MTPNNKRGSISFQSYILSTYKKTRGPLAPIFSLATPVPSCALVPHPSNLRTLDSQMPRPRSVLASADELAFLVALRDCSTDESPTTLRDIAAAAEATSTWAQRIVQLRRESDCFTVIASANHHTPSQYARGPSLHARIAELEAEAAAAAEAEAFAAGRPYEEYVQDMAFDFASFSEAYISAELSTTHCFSLDMLNKAAHVATVLSSSYVNTSHTARAVNPVCMVCPSDSSPPVERFWLLQHRFLKMSRPGDAPAGGAGPSQRAAVPLAASAEERNVSIEAELLTHSKKALASLSATLDAAAAIAGVSHHDAPHPNIYSRFKFEEPLTKDAAEALLFAAHDHRSPARDLVHLLNEREHVFLCDIATDCADLLRRSITNGYENPFLPTLVYGPPLDQPGLGGFVFRRNDPFPVAAASSTAARRNTSPIKAARTAPLPPRMVWIRLPVTGIDYPLRCRGASGALLPVPDGGERVLAIEALGFQRASPRPFKCSAPQIHTPDEFAMIDPLSLISSGDIFGSHLYPSTKTNVEFSRKAKLGFHIEPLDAAVAEHTNKAREPTFVSRDTWRFAAAMHMPGGPVYWAEARIGDPNHDLVAKRAAEFSSPHYDRSSSRLTPIPNWKLVREGCSLFDEMYASTANTASSNPSTGFFFGGATPKVVTIAHVAVDAAGKKQKAAAGFTLAIETGLERSVLEFQRGALVQLHLTTHRPSTSEQLFQVDYLAAGLERLAPKPSTPRWALGGALPRFLLRPSASSSPLHVYAVRVTPANMGVRVGQIVDGKVSLAPFSLDEPADDLHRSAAAFLALCAAQVQALRTLVAATVSTVSYRTEAELRRRISDDGGFSAEERLHQQFLLAMVRGGDIKTLLERANHLRPHETFAAMLGAIDRDEPVFGAQSKLPRPALLADALPMPYKKDTYKIAIRASPVSAVTRAARALRVELSFAAVVILSFVGDDETTLDRLASIHTPARQSMWALTTRGAEKLTYIFDPLSGQHGPIRQTVIHAGEFAAPICSSRGMGGRPNPRTPGSGRATEGEIANTFHFPFLLKCCGPESYLPGCTSSTAFRFLHPRVAFIEAAASDAAYAAFTTLHPITGMPLSGTQVTDVAMDVHHVARFESASMSLQMQCGSSGRSVALSLSDAWSQIFKRVVLGYCGNCTTQTLDDAPTHEFPRLIDDVLFHTRHIFNTAIPPGVVKSLPPLAPVPDPPVYVAPAPPLQWCEREPNPSWLEDGRYTGDPKREALNSAFVGPLPQKPRWRIVRPPNGGDVDLMI